MILGDVVSLRNGLHVESYTYNRNTGELGNGTFSNVYKGHIAGTDSIVAIKEFKEHNKHEYTEELASLQQLTSHNNIISLHHWGYSWNGIFCIVTDYCETTVEKLMTDIPQQVLGQINSFTMQMSEAMRYLKKNCIIHLDLKPSNLLVVRQRLVKLCDFGCSKTVTKNLAVIKPEGGTLHYMSPEVINEDPRNTENPYQCDIWAIGKI